MAEELVGETPDVEELNKETSGMVGGIFQEIISSPLNLVLVGIITFLIFKIFKSRQPEKPSPPSEPELPKLRRDFTVQELKAYDGNQPDGRVLVAVNGKVYDVTRGKRFYGPGKLHNAMTAPILRTLNSIPLVAHPYSIKLLASLHFSFVFSFLLTT